MVMSSISSPSQPPTRPPTTQVVSISLESALENAVQQLRSGRFALADLDDSVKEETSKSKFASTGGYIETYKAELCRVSASLLAAGHTIESQVRALLLHVNALSKSSTTNTPSSDLRGQAKSLSDRILKLT